VLNYSLYHNKNVHPPRGIHIFVALFINFRHSTSRQPRGTPLRTAFFIFLFFYFFILLFFLIVCL
jgi:hypothetical protein